MVKEEAPCKRCGHKFGSIANLKKHIMSDDSICSQKLSDIPIEVYRKQFKKYESIKMQLPMHMCNECFMVFTSRQAKFKHKDRCKGIIDTAAFNEFNETNQRLKHAWDIITCVIPDRSFRANLCFEHIIKVVPEEALQTNLFARDIVGIIESIYFSGLEEYALARFNKNASRYEIYEYDQWIQCSKNEVLTTLYMNGYRILFQYYAFNKEKVIKIMKDLNVFYRVREWLDECLNDVCPNKSTQLQIINDMLMTYNHVVIKGS